MTNKRLIFIDDSGDPGFQKDSSPYLVMASVVFDDPKSAERTSATIKDYRKFLAWKNQHEFKFNKAPKEIIRECLKSTMAHDFTLYAIYIDKESFKKAHSNLRPQQLYNWAIAQLLLTIPFEDAKVKIDGNFDKRTAKQAVTYIRQTAAPNHSRKLEIKYEDSAKNDLIQLADLIAGSVNRSLQKGKPDRLAYLKIIQPKLHLTRLE